LEPFGPLTRGRRAELAQEAERTLARMLPELTPEVRFGAVRDAA
jgi:hypothetical protein